METGALAYLARVEADTDKAGHGAAFADPQPEGRRAGDAVVVIAEAAGDAEGLAQHDDGRFHRQRQCDAFIGSPRQLAILLRRIEQHALAILQTHDRAGIARDQRGIVCDQRGIAHDRRSVGSDGEEAREIAQPGGGTDPHRATGIRSNHRDRTDLRGAADSQQSDHDLTVVGGVAPLPIATEFTPDATALLPMAD